MGIVKTDNSHYTAIAEAIRSKSGSEELFTPAQMGTAIGNIPYESYTITLAAPADTIEIPIDDGTQLVAVFVEDVKQYGEDVECTSAVFWTRGMTVNCFVVSRNVGLGFAAGASMCTVTENSVVLVPYGGAYPYLVGKPYRVVKIGGALGEVL